MHSELRIPILLSLLLAALAPAAVPAQLSCSAVNVLRDGGFERASGAPPVCPDWSGASTQFGSPVCSIETCGSADGAAPRDGQFWTLFGATVDPASETAWMTQEFTLPVGVSAQLGYFLRIGAVSSPYTDLLEVRVDGDLLAAYPEPTTPEGAFAAYTLALDAYADGGAHTLAFEFEGPAGGGFAAFNLDGVTLVVRQVLVLSGGGFEDASGLPLDSPSWIEASTQYSSPICSLAVCGDGAGSVSPRTGDFWAWFGGVGGSTPETSSVSQTVSVPFAAYADLEFQMGVGAVQAPFTDELHVRLDGSDIASYLEPFVADTTYAPYSLIVDSIADGLPHTLQFEYVKGIDGNGANFSLDDVALTQFSCQALLLDGFETHDTSNWTLTLP